MLLLLVRDERNFGLYALFRVCFNHIYNQTPKMGSLLNVVEAVDNVREDHFKGVYKLLTHDSQQTIGFVLPLVVRKIEVEDVTVPKVFEVDHDALSIRISARLDSFEERNSAFASIASKLRVKDELYTLKGWRDELYTVYYPEHEPYFLVERAFSPLLGIVMYGVHLNGYIPPQLSYTGEIQFWVPRRSKTKATFPGMLDNTIAGGIGHPYGIWETLVKESYEEAGISEEYVTAHARQAGVVSYMFAHGPGDSSEKGLIQPELEVVYDMVFDEKTVPTPVDGEAESFELLSLEQVLSELRAGNFKANCGLILVDFLVRHGYITTENETNYVQVVSHLHRAFPFPLR